MASSRSALNEAQTRQQLIDQQLARAGWGTAERRIVEEYLLSSAETEPDYGQQPQEFSDYVLLGRDGKPLAVIEAKRTSRDALAGKRQASDYADRIRNHFGFDPFIFLTNSQTVLFWDRDRYPPREVSGLFTREDLERLAYQRRYSIPPSQVALNTKIAGRDYQTEAIRRVT
jgi:type I restriction enzyme, R subunit